MKINFALIGNGKTQKPKQILGQRMRLRQKIRIAVMASAVSLLIVAGLIIYFQFSNVKPVRAAANGDYRAVATGNWSTAATWQKYNGTTWATATTAPSTGHAIEIQSPYTVTVSSAVTANGITVDAGSTLSVSSGQTLTVSHNTGTDLAVNGTLTMAGTFSVSASASVAVAGTFNMSGTTTATSPAAITVSGTMTVSAGTLTINSGASLTFNSGATLNHTGGTVTNSGTLAMNSGATYIHAMNGGTVPTGTWNSASNLLLTGITSTYPSGMGQTFGNVTFRSGLLSNLEMTSSLSVDGNLNLVGTGIDVLYLSNSSTNRTITVGGNLNDSSGTFIGANSTGTGTITVTGNLNMVGGTFSATSGGGAGTVNVTGILNMSSGTFNDVNSSGAGTVNVTSDLDLSGGTFNVKNGSGTAALNITGNMNTTGGALYERALNLSSTGTITVTGNFSLTAGTIDLTDILSTGTLNVAGNFTHTGGTLTAGLLATGSVVFNGSGVQTYTSGGTVSGIINFSVSSGATLAMGTSVLGSGSSGTFTLASGAGIQIGSTAGITSSGSTGNIQVSGTRTYNAGATYTYNGTSAQNTGNGLPSTLANFTVNNSNGLTLSSNLTISSTLTLTAGTITTGSNTLSITNNATTAIAGFSSSSYVIGNLKLAINGTAGGSGFNVYTFPLGTSSNYELLYFTPENTAGFSSVTGTFTNANPVNSSYPVNDSVSGAAIDSMLNYGYWTLTPNSSMTSGAIDVKIAETGFTGTTVAGANLYTVITRTNSSSSWLTNGNTQAAQYANGAVIANETGISTFGDFGIGYGVGPPILAFNNHTLLSGTDLQVGAVYLFQDVGIGLDAWIQITDFSNGATISDIDNYTYPDGYDDAWQPFVNITSNDTSSVGWKIMFKVAGTSTDTVLANLTFAAIDVDGDGGSTKEFVEAYSPSSVTNSTGSNLTITNSGGNFTAIPKTSNSVANIDTNQTQAMFKVTYKNVSSFNYRTGAIAGSAQMRQASLYFKTFPITGATQLPIALLYFTPTLNSDYVDLTWATASEINNNYFTVERSSNGLDFEELLKKPGSGTTTTMHTYSAFDENPLKGISYYRLKQTDFNGNFTYSPVKPIEYGVTETTKSNVSIATIGPNPFKDNFTLNYNVAQNGNAEILITDNAGHFINRETVSVDKGFNTYIYNDHANLPAGIYFVNLISNGESVTSKMVKE